MLSVGGQSIYVRENERNFIVQGEGEKKSKRKLDAFFHKKKDTKLGKYQKIRK
jgi:hypothetical protein